MLVRIIILKLCLVGFLGCVADVPFIGGFLDLDAGDIDTDTDTDTDSDTDTDTDMDTETETETNQTMVATCAEYLAENPGTVDGPQVLYVGGDVDKPWDVYCHGMAGFPVEYLTLIHTDGDYNFSQYTAGGSSSGTNVRTYYYKLRIDPTTFEVDIGDDEFATSSGSLLSGSTNIPVNSMCYASAMSCISSYNVAGVGNINLLSTSFKVVDAFCIGGYESAGDSTFMSNDQVVDITGGGWCGWNVACPGSSPCNQNCTTTLNLVYIDP